MYKISASWSNKPGVGYENGDEYDLKTYSNTKNTVDCKLLCQSTFNCKGATFNFSKKDCVLKSKLKTLPGGKDKNLFSFEKTSGEDPKPKMANFASGAAGFGVLKFRKKFFLEKKADRKISQFIQNCLTLQNCLIKFRKFFVLLFSSECFRIDIGWSYWNFWSYCEQEKHSQYWRI